MVEESINLLNHLKLKLDSAIDEGDFDKIQQLDREYARAWSALLQIRPTDQNEQSDLFLFLLNQLLERVEKSPEVDNIEASLIRLFEDIAERK